MEKTFSVGTFLILMVLKEIYTTFTIVKVPRFCCTVYKYCKYSVEILVWKNEKFPN